MYNGGMAETFNSSRALFPEGKQRVFLTTVEQKIPLNAMSQICKCSGRTIRDWRREKFAMKVACVHSLCQYACMAIPTFKVRDAYSHVQEAGIKGAQAVIAKYGRIPVDEKSRKAGWRKWWETKGKLDRHPILLRRSIRKPSKDADLAEFIGIMMGDGGISRYQTTITLHHTDDLEYSTFVVRLIKNLFKVAPNIYHSSKDSVNDIAVSRKELSLYLHELGLPIGNKVKQQFDIPKWIKKNKKLAVACLRGLVDTDGCIFTHRYRVKGVWYIYKKLSFTSASKPLRESVHALLQKLNFHSRITNHDVRLDRVEDMKRYFSIINSHNPKHLKRYRDSRTIIKTGRVRRMVSQRIANP